MICHAQGEKKLSDATITAIKPLVTDRSHLEKILHCGGICEIITYAKFGDDRMRGFTMARGQIFRLFHRLLCVILKIQDKDTFKKYLEDTFQKILLYYLPVVQVALRES